MTERPDVALLGVDWQPRALLRAELLEEGFTVMAVDAWATLMACLDPDAMPRLVVVDALHLEGADEILESLAKVMPQRQILVVTAQGTLAPEDLEQRGFQAIARPTSIKDIVTAVSRTLEALDG